MSRIHPYLIGALLCLSGIPPAAAAEPAKRPNILWIVGENIDLDLGCYGEKHVRTPNLDRLAAAGRALHARLRHRAGLRAEPLGVHDRHVSDHDRHAPHAFASRRRLSPARRACGRSRTGCRTPATSPPTSRPSATQVVGTGKLDLNFVNEGPIYQSDDWSALKAHQPFFAQINTPEVEYDIYDRKSGTQAARRVGRRARASADRHAGERHAAAVLSRIIPIARRNGPAT